MRSGSHLMSGLPVSLICGGKLRFTCGLMNTADVSALLPLLLTDAGLTGDVEREPLRVWAHSGVERLRPPGGASVVFKYAEEPFDTEHLALRLAACGGVPTPAVRAARTAPGLLGMLLEDLGDPVRGANDHDGAKAAARLHQVRSAAPGMTRIDTAALSAMPQRIGARLERLDLPGLRMEAWALGAVAASRACGADLPPFGLCHSEFHPTSLHIGEYGWHLLDLARAFVGPGLLDLASWHGTLDEPRPDRTLELIESYVAAGGPPEALARRGGLSAASWALGWHRVWVVDWFAEQIDRGWAQGAEQTWTTAISRHLNEALTLLEA